MGRLIGGKITPKSAPASLCVNTGAFRIWRMMISECDAQAGDDEQEDEYDDESHEDHEEDDHVGDNIAEYDADHDDDDDGEKGEAED